MGRELLDGIAATVGSQPIFYSDLDEKIQGENPVLISAYPSKNSDDLRLKVLQDAINGSLVFMECDRLGLEVNEEQIDQHIRGIAKRNNLTVDALKGVLEQQKQSFLNFRADIKKQALLVLFQRRVLMPTITVTEKEIEDYHLRANGQTKDSVELSTKKIVIKGGVGLSADILNEKEKKINDIYSKLKGSLAFDEAIKLYSADSKEDERVMTYSFEDLAPALKQAFTGLKKGEFTKPVKLTNGFYIFYLVERKKIKNKVFAASMPRIKMELQHAKLETALSQWLKKKREEISVKMFLESK